MSQYIDLPGASGAYVTTPDASQLDVLGDLQLVVKVAADDWTTAGNMRFVEKRNAYNFIKFAGGDFRFEWHDGTNFHSESSSATIGSVGVSDGQAVWLKVTFDVDNGASDADVKFWYSTDTTDDAAAVSWTQLGATQSFGATTAIRNTVDEMNVGAADSGGTSEQVAGNIYQVLVYDGIDGTLVAHFDGCDFIIGDTDTDTATGADGLVWTIHGSAVIAGTPCLVPSSGARLTVLGAG